MTGRTGGSLAGKEGLVEVAGHLGKRFDGLRGVFGEEVRWRRMAAGKKRWEMEVVGDWGKRV